MEHVSGFRPVRSVGLVEPTSISFLLGRGRIGKRISTELRGRERTWDTFQMDTTCKRKAAGTCLVTLGRSAAAGRPDSEERLAGAWDARFNGLA